MSYYWFQSRGSHFIGLVPENQVNPFYKKLQKLEIPNLSLRLSYGPNQTTWVVVENPDKTFEVYNSPLGVNTFPLKAYVLKKPLKNASGKNCLEKEKLVEIANEKALCAIFGVPFTKPKRKK